MIGEQYKVAAFDFDDCLVATIKNIWEQHKYVASSVFGVNITDEQLAKVWGRPLPELVQKLYGQPFDRVEPHLLACKPMFPKEVFPSSIPLLRSLKAAGKVIAVVTSTNTNSIAVDLRHNNFPEGIIDHLFTIDDCEYHKPDPRVFEPLFAEGYDSSEVVYVGDAASDFFAARDAGIDFIGVATGLLSVEQFNGLSRWHDVGAAAVPSVATIYELFAA